MTVGQVVSEPEPGKIVLPEPPAAADAVFGPRLDTARRYAAALADRGVAHGHLGPRELPRLWQRHLLNSALLADLLPHGIRVVDVGSGAGLPGLPIAIRRADLRVDLVEPMLRRVRFLTDVVTELDLADQVHVIRGRAEDAAVRAAVGDTPRVVARAVAPLDRLVGWCLPLLAADGQLLALKGESAHDEVSTHARQLEALGARVAGVQRLAGPDGVDATHVVIVSRSKYARKDGQ